jgi:hypothetical protein
MVESAGGSKQGDAPPPSGEESVYEVSRGLYELALRYWSEGAEEQARRVAIEARRILGAVDPTSELLERITSAIQALSGPPATGLGG